MQPLFLFNKLPTFLYLSIVIRFQKNTTNKVVVTLTENSTVSNPYYLFQFTNQTSKVDYYFIASDISNFKERYNEFSVTERDSPNTLQGQVQLGEEGFYNYTVYQTNLSTLTGLTNASEAVSNITKTVEFGKVWVVPNNSQIPTYTGQDDTLVIYTPYEFLLQENGGYLLQENGQLIIL